MARELSPTAQKAKALRQELKAAFPTVKFSVTSNSSIRVSWTDGVTGDKVKAIAEKYESISRCAYSGEILSGGNTYVFLTRHHSLEAYTEAVKQVCKDWGLEIPVITDGSLDPYIRYEDDAINVGGGIKNLSELAREVFSETDYTQTKAIEEVETVEPIAAAPEALEAIKTAEVIKAVAEARAEIKADTTEAEEAEPVDETVQSVLEMRRDRLEERQANKEEAYTRLAAKHSQESDRRYQSAHAIGSMIPFGQPIHIGHHSEKRHRGDLNRIDANMRKSIEHDKTAAYYQDKLAAMQANTAISSDDPDALEKLKAKLEGMEESQEYMKRINGYMRQVLKLEADKQVDALAEMAGVKTAKAYEWLNPRWGDKGFAGYSLTNNNGNMRRARERIAEIEASHKAIAEHGEALDTDYEDLGLKVVMNLAINRLQFVFDGKPEDAVRAELKSDGFRWSPREGAWQRQLNAHSKYLVDRMIKALRSLKTA